ncbi:type IA DNA topoisomerase [Peribacillus deserti]|uniref:DNA topoisomerase n=1 Tax=Peribacillus deserti TaxID=673318 RepID=A0A2N5M231_9BACI|nr:type IA DNA topoisomerase [Peribacillus deserti]PLT28402.1 DNA topoisomerase III [Peribacillus deserti]
MKKVIIAEKPSVAKNIADALRIKTRNDGYYEGSDYIITWAFGHLLQLYDAKDYDSKMTRWKMENFPFIPGRFQYKVKSSPKNRDYKDPGAVKQIKIISSLVKRNDVDAVISACDFDREGQIIGDTIIDSISAKKKVYRLLLNEWTQEEVIKGLNSVILNTEMKPLRDAGISRQWADWIIGINLTSVATLKYQSGRGQALNVGRVLMPTLKIIYDRDKEIESFVPEIYFKLGAVFGTQKGQVYEGSYYEKGEDKFKSDEQLKAIVKLLKSQTGFVADKKVEKKKEYPPYLFNLTGLQGYITSKYKGWTSDKVLRTAQSLYEKKFITYPRTSSTALEESLKGRTAKVLDAMKKGLPFEGEIKFTASKRIFDNSKVESHSAIIPTYMVPKKLTGDEQLVYTAIKNRFLMQFMPVAEYEETKITTKIHSDEIKGEFLSKGKVQLVEGWKKLENSETKEVILPQVGIGEDVAIQDAKISQHKTTPPKQHTERTLLRVMETCGRKLDGKDEERVNAVLSGYSIGTPATRADTIKKLKDIGYIEYQNKNLVCTELGRNVVETLPVSELFDLDFTGKIEKKLYDIEKRRYSSEEFLEFIRNFIFAAVHKLKSEETVVLKKVEAVKKETEVLGKCPVCGHPIIEGQKGFGCSNWKSGCKFVIWKNDKYLAAMKKKPTKTMVKALLKNGQATVKGLTSKKGKKFNAILKYEKNPDNSYFTWKMEFAD